MKNKLIIVGSLIVLLVFGFIYSQNSSLMADDKDGKKDCSSSCTQKTSSTENKSQCTDKQMSGATSGDDKSIYAVYEFVTDKISCDDCKPGMTQNIMGIAGVKEVDYGATCNVSKMTSVKVYFMDSETTPEIIAASVKEQGLQGKCGDGTKCDSKNKSQKKS